MSVSTVLVTGAGGYVGSRLTHRIALGEDLDVVPLVHSPTGPETIRLARLPVDIEQGSILDRERMDELLADVDGVVHCAFGSEEATVDGTKNVLELAERNGVESLVHMSTAIVHGHGCQGTVDETAPFDPDTEYAEWKVETERMVQELVERGELSPAVLRPFIVYGPRGRWVRQGVDRIERGAVLADGGRGTLNQIYVDNLVDAILLALQDPAADGEAFFVVDDEEITWKRFYDRIAAQLDDHPPMEELSRRRVRLRNSGRRVKKNVVPPMRIPKHVATSGEVQQSVASELNDTPWVRSAFGHFPEGLQETILEKVSEDGPGPAIDGEWAADGEGKVEPDLDEYHLPSGKYVTMQSTANTFSNQKLKDVLGWEQRVSFEESMEFIEDWMEYEDVN